MASVSVPCSHGVFTSLALSNQNPSLGLDWVALHQEAVGPGPISFALDGPECLHARRMEAAEDDIPGVSVYLSYLIGFHRW